MTRAASLIAVVMILIGLCHPATAQKHEEVITAQSPAPAAPSSSPASTPATAQDLAKLRQSLEQMRTELAALNRRITVIEEELNSIKSR